MIQQPPGRAARQRQKLIDACISALHQHGPSRTTIDKVVAIADMSPGIVSFYFDSKAALLVAALEHLAQEFEDCVLIPLQAVRADPVTALPRLIDLYLDAEIASPRKVSVWYAFWGEATSRQEYFDICGRRDQAFADLVGELMARLIETTRARHLQSDSVALGLIGCLEMVWQAIAFREEADTDREAGRQRCHAYLASLFPAQFANARLPALASSADLAAPVAEAAAYAFLVTAECMLAGVPAAAMPAHFPYHVLAQPHAQPPQRIHVTIAAANTHIFSSPAAHAAEWLAVVVNTPRSRDIYCVPAAAIPRDGISVATLRGPLAKYRSNFALDMQGAG